MKGKPFYYQDNRALHERRMNESVRVELSRQNIEFILAHQNDSPEALTSYLRSCRDTLGHVPAQVEVLGGELLTLRFGSWGKALESAGLRGGAAQGLPLERTALFQAEYKRQSEWHVQQKKERKKQAEAARRERKAAKNAAD